MPNDAVLTPATLIPLCILTVCVLGACHARSPLEPVSHRPVGVVVQHLTVDDANELLSMGVTAVRLSWYGDLSDLLAQFAVAQDAGLQVLIVTHAPITAEYVANIGRLAVTQVGNEPLDPVAYGAAFRLIFAQYQLALTLIPAGLSNDVDAVTLAGALATGYGDAGVVCLHAYGEPLVNAITDRLTMFDQATYGMPTPPRLMFTEVGAIRTKGDLGPALAMIPLNVPVYVFALDDVEGFALTNAEQTVIASLTGAR